MKTQTKRLISSLLIAANLTLPANITLAKEESKHNTEIVVKFNNEQIEFDQQPIIVDGRTKVPFRAIFETMGTVVYYRNSDSSILGITRDGDIIKHTVGTNKATINGIEKTYDSVSQIVNDRTLIPVRMVADLLQAEVEWIEKTKTVEIEKDIITNEYHKKVRNILECTLDSNFNPEDFKRYLDYQSKHPEINTKQVILDVNMDLDREMVEVDTIKNIDGTHFEAKEEDISIINNPHNPLVLVNRYNKLPDDYKPQNTMEVDLEHRTGMYAEISSIIYNDYLELYNAGVKDGFDFKIIQGIIETNPELASAYFYTPNAFYLRQESYAFNLYPLHRFCELETGLAINVVAVSSSYTYFLKYAHENNILPVNGSGKQWTQEQFDLKFYGSELDPNYPANYRPQIDEEDRKYNWLENNSYKYGFVVRYPKGKENITKYYYMPWHLRYVGKEVAKVMHDENLCLEEYYAKYINPSGYVTDLKSTKEKVLKLY